MLQITDKGCSHVHLGPATQVGAITRRVFLCCSFWRCRVSIPWQFTRGLGLCSYARVWSAWIDFAATSDQH
jgi:hypothetical protein